MESPTATELALPGLEGEGPPASLYRSDLVEPNFQVLPGEGGLGEPAGQAPDSARVTAGGQVHQGPAAQTECAQALQDLARVAL